MSLLAVAAGFAEAQLGLVTRRQLLAAGVPRTTIDKAVRSGRLVVEAPRVLRLAGAPRTAESRLLADALSVGDDAVYSHRSAAWLWGLLVDPPRLHELSVPRGHRPDHAPLLVHEARDLDLAASGFVRGVPVTGVGRTILDCARYPDVDVELLIDEARRTLDVSRTLLPTVLVDHSCRGRPGLARLRAALDAEGLPDSDFERLVVRWLGRAGVAGWRLHHRVTVGDTVAVVDLAWPELRVAVELEGRDHWDRARRHDADARRQNHLELAGWLVLRVTYRRWLRDPAGVLAEIRAALAARTALLAG